MNTPLHVGTPNIGDRKKFHQYVDEMFDRRWLTNRGERVRELERRLAEYLGVRHCITMCNGTVALEIAIQALGLGGEVLLPSLTFVATAHVLKWLGIKPVFCDIDRNSYTLNPAEIERHVTPHTTGILGVHVYGRSCDIDGLRTVADRHRLALMFDAAHAFGNTYHGRMIGNFGRCEVFSFHATKFYNTFEGGAITTNDNTLAEKIRLMKNFGFQGLDHTVSIGTNGKMSEIHAAMGLVNLDAIESFLAVNRKNYDRYQEMIGAIPGLKLITFDEKEQNNRQYVVVEVGPDFPLSRDALIEKLRAQNVLARRYFWPGCHCMEPYKTLQPDARKTLPVTEEVARRIVVLPTGTAMNAERIDRIGRIIREAGKK